MSAGSFVFPVTILTFFLVLTGWVVSHPATPAPFRGAPVEPGNNVTFHYTTLVGRDQLVVFETSRSDLNLTQTPWSPNGHVEVEPGPITIPGTDPQAKQFLGHRVGDTFRTAALPTARGQWQQTRTVSLILGTTTNGSGFQDGQTLPATIAFVFDSRHPHPQLNLTVNATGPDTLQVRLDAAPGHAFNLAPNALGTLGGWTPGAYRVVAVDGDNATVRYSAYDATNNSQPAQLIEEPVWTEFTIMGTERPHGPA